MALLYRLQAIEKLTCKITQYCRVYIYNIFFMRKNKIASTMNSKYELKRNTYFSSSCNIDTKCVITPYVWTKNDTYLHHSVILTPSQASVLSSLLSVNQSKILTLHPPVILTPSVLSSLFKWNFILCCLSFYKTK